MSEPTKETEAPRQAPVRPDHVGYYFDETTSVNQDPPLILLRAPLYLMLLLLVVTAVFSTIGQMDVVVSGQAMLAPVGRTWNLQSEGGGQVQKLLVKEGERVSKGQVLILFQKGISPEGLTALREELENATFALRRTEQGAAEDLGLGREMNLLDASVVSPALQDLIVQYAKARLGFIEANRTLMARLPLEARALAAERAALSQKLGLMSKMERKNRVIQSEKSDDLEVQRRAKALEFEQIRRDLTRSRLRLQDVRTLRDRKLISEDELRNAQLEASRLETNLSVAEKDSERLAKLSRIARSENSNLLDSAKIDMSNTQVSLTNSENQLARLKNEAKMQYERARSDYANAVFILKQQLERLQQQTDFAAPVDGIITSLKVHNAGEVVGAGQLLATMAPAMSGLGAEIVIANKDIGLIKEGMSVKFKLDAYPYQDYGVLRGWILQIPQDIDEKQGFYRVQATLDRSTIKTEKGEVPLRYGLTAHGEVVTKRQRLIELFLEPFKKKERHG